MFTASSLAKLNAMNTIKLPCISPSLYEKYQIHFQLLLHTLCKKLAWDFMITLSIGTHFVNSVKII